MSNPFDQFDAATPQGDSNPFDQFDAGKKKDSRSAVGEIANQFKAGILVDLPKMAGQALKYTSDPGNKVYEAGQGITDWADEQGKRPDLAPQEDQHNIVTNALASGARMIPQSIAPAAVVGAGIAALPASIPAAVGLGAASVLGAVPAAMSQGQETLEKAREKGIPEDQALAAARSNALIEGGGEALGTYAGGKLLGIAGKTAGKMFGRTAGDALADQTSTAITKPFLKQLGKTALVETGTEIGQNAGEAAVENAYGIDSKTPYQAGKEAIAPTLGMTALLAPFGLAGFAHAGKKRGERTDALSSADTSPEDRQKIAGEFAAEIGKVDEQAAANFMANAQYAIDGKQALSIGESMFSPPVAAEETPAPLALPAPTYTGTPSDQVMAAEVERQNQADAAQKSADALYAERAAFEQANAGIAATPAIPVVGPLSAAANIAVQSGAHAATVAQQAAAQTAQNTTPEGKAGTPAGVQPSATAPAQGPLAEVAAQAPATKEPANVSAPTQAAPQADQANAPNAGAKATEATGDSFIRTRTDAQLNWLAERGKPEFKAAAAAEIQARVGQVSVAPEMPNGDGVTDQPTDTGIPMSVANQEPVKNASPTAATVPAEPVVQNQEPIKSAEQPASADPALQNRDRGRAASVNQMQSIARNPDYMRLGPSRTPDSGAPMVFAVGGDTNKISPASMGGADIAVMADGQRVPFRYAVVDASSVEPSNFADGAANPAFASMAPGTIKALNNGRTAGVRAAHEGRKAANYTAELLADQAHGVSPEAIRSTPNPMLVRVYAEQANTGDMAAKSQGQGLGMSASERATQDAELMTSEVLDKFAPGDIASAGNRDFVRAFVGKLAENELADMMDATGNLSQDGRRRIEAALLTAAYGKSDLVQELFESTDTDIKAIGNALKVMSGQWASMRNAAKDGVIDPDTDMTANLIEAVNIVRRSRAEGSSIAELAGQGDLMGGNYLNELSELFLRIFYKGKNYDRARGGDKVIAALQEIVTSAMNTKAEAGLFGDSFKATPKQIVESARSKIDEENKPASQSSLFGANGQATAVSQGNRSEGAAKSGEVGQRPVGTGRSEETGKQAEPVERSISDLQKELESAKFGERTELNGILIERVSEDAERSIKQGEMPMYQTGQGTFVALHPSAQQDGMIQATRYSDTGVFGDSQYKEVKEAVRDNGLWFKRRLPDAEAARLLEQSIAAEAEYQKRKNGASEPVAKAAEQSPAVDSKQSNDADLESRILIAADSIDKLRKVDVERVLMQGNIDRQKMADYIKRKRPEFSDEVDSVIEDATAAAENTEEAKTSTVDAKKEAKPEAKPDPKPKDAKAPKIETVSDMTQSLAKAGYGHGTLPMNRSEIRVGLNMSAPFSDQRFEAVINLRGGKWNVSEVEVPDLKSEGMRDAMNKFRADLADLNEGRYPDEEAKKPDSAKTADAGEELTYNKRNRRTGGLKWDDIKDRNAALRIKEVVKAKVYPKPDYQALVDGGMKDVVAHIVKQAYDSIAPSPKLKRGAEPTDEALQSYIAGVNRVMDGVMKWANDGTAVAKWAKAQSKLSGGSFSISELATAETLLDTVYPGGWKSYREEIIMMGGNKMLGALQPGHDEVGRAMKDIKLGWPAKSEAWQKQGYKVVNAETIDVELYAKPARGDSAAYVSGMVTANNQRIDSFMVRGTSDKESPEVQAAIAEKRKQLEGNYVLVDKSGRIEGVFPAEEPAIEAAREKVKRDSGEKIGEKGVSVETAERLGIEHRLPGDDVTSERLKETFGFRGVNFGNWMQGDTKAKVNERQLHLNHLFDAFMDLAQLLNLPPKALSLNGMLGIAVGAQGSGKALAHFVPGVNEINVTRTKGAGALAHEWGHALDHYFATMGGLDRKKEPYLSAHVGTLDGRVENGRYVRTPVALADVRPEIAGQFQSIVEAMTKRHETDAEYEARIRSEKAIAGRLVADEIKEIVASIGEAKTGWGTPELIAKVRGLAARIASLDYGEGRVSMGGTEVPAVVAEIADAYKESSGVPLKNVNALGYHADRYRVISGILESADGREPRTVPTDYKKASEAADAKKKPYWSTKLEMFARAFDAYVVDRLAEKAAKNSYLSGIEAVAPQGEERKAIGKAFDFLFAELKTKETEHGTAIYNIAGKDALLPADTAIYGMAAEGKSAEDILKFIGSASRNPFYRQLAKLLMKTGIAPTITVGDGKGWKFNAGEGNKYAAGYNPTTNTISLFRPASAERNMLHELMHAATLKALSGKGMASAQMKALFAHVEKTGRAHGLFYDKATKRGVYGMANVDEFIAEAFSNPKFQEQLKKVAAPTATGGKLSSAWDWFVRVVRGILGIPQGQENALSQALEIGVGVMRENMRLNEGTGDVRYNAAPGKINQTDTPAFKKLSDLLGPASVSGDMISGSYQAIVDRLNGDSEFFSNLLESKSFATHGYGGVDVPTKRMVLEHMLSVGENAEIARRVIASIPVDVMNFLFGKEFSTKNILSNKSMLEDVLSVNTKPPITLGVNVSNAIGSLIKFVATNTAKVSDLANTALKELAASDASGGNGISLALNRAEKFSASGNSVWMPKKGSATPSTQNFNHDESPISNTKRITDSDSFSKWFGDSKVVDANGDPLVVYHGTGATDISEFKVSTSGTYGGGIYLTPEIRGANDYAIYRGAPSSTVYPVYAAIKNPASGSEAAQVASWKGEENAREELIKRGYDGVVDMRSGEIVAFYPEQIKSAIGNNGNFSPSNHDIRYNVADEGWSVAEPSKMDDVIYALQDKHIDTKRVMQAIMGAGKKIKDSFNPYLQEELFHGRSAKGVKDFLDFELRPLLKQMQDAKVDMGDFEEYLWNRHAEERNQQIAKINPDMQDGGSGIETATARAYLAGLGAEQRRTFESLAAKVEAMNKASQRVLVESGLEKQSTIDAWNGAYKHYVPLQREDVDNGHVGTGKGFSVRGSATKRAMGSGKNVVDIIANLTMQRERNIVRAEKNRVSNALMGLAVENPNKDFWTVDVAPKERVVEETAIYTVVDEGGAKLGEFTRMSEAEKLANKTPGSTIDQKWGDRVTERVVPGFKNRDNVLLTRVNGDDHYIIFNERDERAMRMATAMKNMDVDNLGRVLSLVGRATRYLSAINTQYNPVFGVINLIRDAQGALLNLSSTPLAGEQKRVMAYTKDALVGIYKDIRAHRAGLKPSSNWASLFEEFQREGGATGYRDQYANAEARAEAIKAELEQFKEGKAKQLTRGLFGWLSDYNETMENAVRLASYKAAIEKGMSKVQAASLAKNITVNFNRKGQMATQVGSLYAFFNASVQGTARIAGTLFDMKDGDIKTARLSKTGKKIVYGGIMLGSMQALLLAAAGFGDDEPPDFIKERNLILPIGDGKYLTLAMPLGYHVFPGIGRLATEFVLSGGKDPLKKIAAFGSMFAEALNPIGNSGFSLQTITPSVIDPLAALAENRDFTGKEIYQNDFNKLNPTPGFTRAKDTATAWSKAIAEGLNFITGGTDYKPGLFTPTPDQIDYLIGQVTGGVGREVGKVSQVVSATTTGEDLPIYKVPLVGRFVGDTQGKSGESAKFYNSLREINMHEAEYKGLIGDGKRQEAAEYLAENPAVKLIMLGNQSERAVKKLKEAKRNLIENDAPQEKVAAMEDQIAKSMKLFNDRVTKSLAQ